jgi:hypothetical protein
MPNYPSVANTDSNLYIGVNNLSTVLTDAPLTAGATTVNVSDTTGFPTVGIITIELEAIEYTGTTGTSFTGCTRGFDGTTGVSHPVSTTVFHDIPAAHHNVLKDEIIAVTDDIRDAITGDLDDAVAPAATAGDLKIRLDHVATALKNATGEADWKTVPPETLASLETDKAEDSVVVKLTGVQSIAGNKTFTDVLEVDGQLIAKGTATNDAAAAGDIGEEIRSAASAVTFPATTVWGDLTSISLTAGDWLVSVLARGNTLAAGLTEYAFAITTTAGDSTTGIVDADNSTNFRGTLALNDRIYNAIPSYRISLASTTTVFLKFQAVYSSTAPDSSGRISAVRIR